MRLQWTDKELKYFRKGIKEVKQTEDINEYSWWILFGAVIIMEIIVAGKIIGII